MIAVFANNDTARWAALTRVLLLLIAAGALVLIGRMSAAGPRDARLAAGVPTGFERSVDGSRSAAITYAAARARAKLLAPERRRMLLQAIGTPAFVASADREDEQQDLAPLSGQDEGRYLVTGLGSQVERCAGERCRVTVWLLQVWAADTAVGSFSTQTVSLVWSDGRWRLDRQADSEVQAVPAVTQTPRYADTRGLTAVLEAPTFGRP